MTIAIHMLSGNFSLVTATDTQETYSTGQRVQVGKISSCGRIPEPSGAMNIAGAGDPLYSTALMQDISRFFLGFSGTLDELEQHVRSIVRDFYTANVFPLVGRIQDENMLDYSLLLATKHAGITKLWKAEKMLLIESVPFDCAGVGKPTAESLLNRLYPRYPTLESCAILAAYVIYHTKSSVEGCGLKTEIRFIQGNQIGIVPSNLIEKWELLFRQYEGIQREIFYHAMNFVLRPALPEGIEAVVGPPPPQMRKFNEIVQDIERIRAEFATLSTFNPPA